MVSYGKSDVGKVRKHNEDSFRITEGDDWVSALVCDGMGGAHGGEVASELAVCVYTDELFKEIGKSGADLSGQIIKGAMLSAVAAANKAVVQRATEDEELEGMGTTLVACFAWRDKCFVVNVGDSRLYKKLGDKTEQVTKDHSFVQFLVDNGKITPEEADKHPNRNVITRALGINDRVEADFFMVDSFESVLLCSDGLINYVKPEDLQAVLANDRLTVKKKVNNLVAAANKAGGGDNITVILLSKGEK